MGRHQIENLQSNRVAGGHGNAFGFIRLVFASAVIVSHTVDMIHGDYAAEIVYRLTGTRTLAMLAVEGFFIISGFLITASLANSTKLSDYLWKRVIRIFPAFIVCSLICLAIIGPAAGGGFSSAHDWLLSLVRMVFLFKPEQTGVFSGNPIPVLNAPAWTIQYEFACYLGIAALGVLGILRRPLLVAALAVLMLLISALIQIKIIPGWDMHLVRNLPRLIGMFLAGATLYFCQDRVPLNRTMVVVASAGLASFILSELLVNFGVAVFGTFLIFALAQWGGGNVLRKINNRNDISYGLYLYAWPIESLLIFYGFSSFWALVGLTWLFAALAGGLSWFVLEKPILRHLKPRR